MSAQNQPAHDQPAPATFTIATVERRGRAGGAWVTGAVTGFAFEALVFPEAPFDPSYEVLPGSRVSKVALRAHGERLWTSVFDRGWDTRPTSTEAKAAVEAIAAGLAKAVFGE